MIVVWVNVHTLQSKIVVAPGMTGGEMESFLQVAEILLMGLVNDEKEMETWYQHVNIVRFLHRESFTEEDTEILKEMIITWKHHMCEVYGPLGYNLCFPNFEVCEHWWSQIHYLGPPWLQNTKLWEHCHLEAKKTCKRTNQRNTENAVLRKVLSLPSSNFESKLLAHKPC